MFLLYIQVYRDTEENLVTTLNLGIQTELRTVEKDSDENLTGFHCRHLQPCYYFTSRDVFIYKYIIYTTLFSK